MRGATGQRGEMANLKAETELESAELARRKVNKLHNLYIHIHIHYIFSKNRYSIFFVIKIKYFSMIIIFIL